MKKSRYTEEQIAFALRQAEGGTPIVEVCRKMGISEQTFFRWKKKFAGMGIAEVRRLKQLEEENRKLKALVADLALDKAMLQDALRGKTLTPDRRRSMVRRARMAYRVSERRACRVLHQARATQRYESVADDQAVLRSRIREIAGVHVTWGYPRIWVKLRREGWRVNRKRVYRLYRQEGLCVGRHKPRRHRSAVTRPARTTAMRVNESWSMDFMADQLFDGRKFRLLTLVDDFSRESPVIELDQRLTGERVAAILDRIGRERGLPEKIRVDNGSEFTGRVLDQWAYLNHVRLDFNRRGKPTDNGLIEAFNGRLRAECLNENWFMSLDDARSKVEAWRRHYNEERPHSALGNLAPREFAASTGQTCPAG
ncbi:MAG: IS3 family transposase [Phycisphaeraceae bacterium]|nr:IS3 family transposase [Phycisphaeraceae bacterium]